MHERRVVVYNKIIVLLQVKASFIGPSCTEQYPADIISEVVSELENHTCVKFRYVQTRIFAEHVTKIKICYIPDCSKMLVKFIINVNILAIIIRLLEGMELEDFTKLIT